MICNSPDILISRGGTSYTTPAAVEYFRLKALAAALGLQAVGIGINRQIKPTMLLRHAEAATGLKFKRGQYAQARQAVLALAAKQESTLKIERQA